MTGGPSSTKLDLPIVSYSLLSETLHQPPTLEDHNQFTTFGYNSQGQVWKGYQECTKEGGHRYMRWLQPLESELAIQVEYDMDDQDRVWLDSINQERKKEGGQAVPYEAFEIIMDKIEKEWFDLTKSIPKKSNALPSENDKCAICDDGECENSNAIVFCDGCNLAVHQDCYGVPYIPEGQWLCRKCTVSPDKPVNCIFCPNSFGAFKQTTTGHWAHLLCAIWIPETGVSNTVYMEPVDGVELIPKSRWKLVCYLCKKRLGACIQCSNRNCYTAYHVTCAREFGLEVKMKQGGGGGGNGGGELKSWCDKHGKVQTELFVKSRAATPANSHRIPSIASPSTSNGNSSSGATISMNPSLLKLTLKLPAPSQPKSTRSTLAYKKNLLSAPPLIPAFVFDRVMNYVNKIKGITGKKEFVSLVCRYWSLKREGRRGAPLLKRIHLEPWTASATTRLQSDSDRAAKLELIRLLRNDLEKVRMLTEQVRKREKKKLERVVWIKNLVAEFVWPKEDKLRKVLAEIVSLDKQQYFLKPVDRSLVPDYYDIIKTPMDWTTMSQKLDRHEYKTGQEFQGDIQLVINNARRYNKPYTPIHRAAVRLLESLESTLASLEALDDPLSDLSVREALAPMLFTEDLRQVVGEERELDGANGASDAGGGTTGGTTVVNSQPKNVLDELEQIWYNVEDPTGERKRKAEEEERKKIEDERIRVEKEKVAQEKKAKKEEAERIKAEKAKEKGKNKAGEDVEMGPPAPVDSKAKKRLAATAGLDEVTNSSRGDTTPVQGEEGSTRTSRSKVAAAAAELAPPSKKSKTAPHKSVTAPKKETAEAPLPTISPKIGDAAPLEAEAISSRDTFKLFETGWVLPEGSSRRKPRSLISSRIIRITTSYSRISTTCTATPLATTKPLPVEPAAPVASTSRKTPRTSTAPPPSNKESKPSVKEKEKVTNPFVKPREKVPAVVPRRATPISIPTNSSFASSTGTPNRKEQEQMIRDWQHQVTQFNSIVVVGEETDLSQGTLVWHRTHGSRYPWYPAEVLDPDDKDFPPALLKGRPKTLNTPRVPVVYFDSTRSGQWALRAELRLMGESDEFDRLMLVPAAIRSLRKDKGGGMHKSIATQLAELTAAFDRAQATVEPEDAGQSAKAGSRKKAVAKKGRSK